MVNALPFRIQYNRQKTRNQSQRVINVLKTQEEIKVVPNSETIVVPIKK